MAQVSRYPARVYDGEQLVTNRGAVIVNDGRLIVAAFTADKRGVQIVLERAGVNEIEAHISRATLLHFHDGSTIKIQKGDGCSCRNVLQRWYREQLGAPARSGT